ncbi:hypothetical protein F3I27_20420 [Pantoea sp. Bo_2]|uniref:Uncharacterized protein n=1 Tax=Candidatus Pantoea gossypiicola TaxID=2608008 RepID=A0AB34CCZ2_9GAMM|nr:MULTISPECIES: hypothetical protein [Pantoea]KAA5922103.1 hypothetical protein F3I59_22605 [Pantoea sp. VH_8]KAA5928496.1 hypothetical protein F3I58_22265 [Pantoea sp. VH_4]KAA5937515.1 hypothetical protein F3I57_21590 [Pantoea sp. VH_3]KAA5948107.1 hypothetical protein F3I56_20625 [Pantoea sp. VH_25]KAA5977851.1 hypothetical protein F3I48_20395 [Pantoea sp. M_3]
MVLKSEVENDAKIIMESLEADYRIPTSSEIILPLIKVMSVVYLMHVLAVIVNEFVYKDDVWLLGIGMWLFLSCGILTGMALIMTYGNLSLMMCIPKKVRDESLLFAIGKRKLKVYGYVIVAINVAVGIMLINGDHEFIFGYGASWFVCMLIGGITFSMSMSRYMTPAVVATLDKIRQVVSDSDSAPTQHAANK